jgi:hypothetical protein
MGIEQKVPGDDTCMDTVILAPADDAGPENTPLYETL